MTAVKEQFRQKIPGEEGAWKRAAVEKYRQNKNNK